MLSYLKFIPNSDHVQYMQYFKLEKLEWIWFWNTQKKFFFQVMEVTFLKSKA